MNVCGLPTDHIMVPYTPFVVEAGGKRYLLDTGFADNGPAGTGLLHENMEKAGIEPASIDVVLMSHLHGDHINGLRRKDGSLVYPDATVYIPQPEFDHWMDDEKMAGVPEAGRGGFLAARSCSSSLARPWKTSSRPPPVSATRRGKPPLPSGREPRASATLRTWHTTRHCL